MDDGKNIYVENLYQKNFEVDLNVLLVKIGGEIIKKESTSLANKYNIKGDKYLVYNNNKSLAYNPLTKKCLNAFGILKEYNIIKNSFDFNEFIKNLDNNLVSNEKVYDNKAVKFDVTKYRIYSNHNHWYLLKERGISKETLEMSIFKDLIFGGNMAIFKHNNTILKLRTSFTESNFQQLVIINPFKKDRRYIMGEGQRAGTMFISNKVTEVIDKIFLFESFIDLASYVELYKDTINNAILASTLGNVDKNQIQNLLNMIKGEKISKLLLCFDKDNSGKNHIEYIKNSLKLIEEINWLTIETIEPELTDFNEDLLKKNH